MKLENIVKYGIPNNGKDFTNIIYEIEKKIGSIRDKHVVITKRFYYPLRLIERFSEILF